ncbi:hypothetical protein L7F22_048205 [Adiantum nelumboides]|nr:hypothetical protein [Adiantum nelumboides]
MHTFCGMVGYCLKDSDQPHFCKVEHNISADDVNEGIELHSLYGADAMKNKGCLTPTNVFDHALIFWRFKMRHPIGNGFLDTLQRMVKTGRYYPFLQWIIPYQGRGMPTGKIESLWKCMTHPFMVTQGIAQRLQILLMRAHVCKTMARPKHCLIFPSFILLL